MNEVALSELEKASRKLQRMTTARQFRKPSDADRAYREPTRGNAWGDCIDCGRPRAYGSGMRCRECFQRQVRENYERATGAETERVRIANEALTRFFEGEAAMEAKQQLPATPITRSTSGLRTALFEEMEALRNGESNAQRARSVAMMANSILQSVQVEIEYHKYVKSNEGRVVGQNKTVQLGTDISLAA